MACGTTTTEDGDGGDDGGGVPTTTAETGADDEGNGSPGGEGGGTSSATPTGDGNTADDDDADGGGEPPITFDLGIIPDAPMFCNQGEGEVEASYIWVANSSQGSISKINTQTMIEEGRYVTRPDGAGSPSRTSVSLTGNVVTANRNGGITKFYANLENCSGGSTSNNGTSLPWGSEDCMAWHTPMAYSSQRPVAWTQGEWDQAACGTINEKVWTSGTPDGSSIEVLLVDGDTGIVEDTIPIPGVTANYFGIYGAAVDSEGNFWGSQLGQGQLVNVNLQNLQVSTWPMGGSGYGMTVDSDGYVWTCTSTVSRFDPATETWQTAAISGASGGCMADGNGTLWMAGSALRGINQQTLAIDQTLTIPGSVHGVSVDFYGNIWGVAMGANAYRVDPNTGIVDTFTGLVGAYTYSDMTGFALSNVGGGGAPSG